MAIDNKKEQERDELHRAIWAIADELRGAVDGWDFKNYVLGTMFYRYVSENITNYINAGEYEAGNTGFDYANMSDADAEEARQGLVEEKGFFILPSELFCNVRANAKDDENLNESLETVFRHIEESAKGSESESDFAGLFDDFDVNSNKLGPTVAKRNEKLCKLLDGVADMKLGDVKNHDIDAFGDAYEYLMTMYASNAGKSGGEFFTPADVSELLTRLGTVGKTEINKVYEFKEFFALMKNRISDGLDVPAFFRDLVAMITNVPEEWDTPKDPSSKLLEENTLRTYAKRGISAKFAKSIVYNLSPEMFIESLESRPAAVLKLFAEDYKGYDSTATADNIAMVGLGTQRSNSI